MKIVLFYSVICLWVSPSDMKLIINKHFWKVVFLFLLQVYSREQAFRYHQGTQAYEEVLSHKAVSSEDDKKEGKGSEEEAKIL